MNPIALLSGYPRVPNSKDLRRAKTYGFWCEVCRAAYTLWVPDDLSFEQAGVYQKIGRGLCTKEHPHHSEQIDLPLSNAFSS
jgi:hypothetical protein